MNHQLYARSDGASSAAGELRIGLYKGCATCEVPNWWLFGRAGRKLWTPLLSNMVAMPAKRLKSCFLSDIDVVYIATLPDSHNQYSAMALNHGKHVLCEKPAATNLAILESVLKIAKSKNLLFMEGMKPPFFPLYGRLKEYLQTDPIGPVGYVRAGSAVADCPPEHPNYSHELIGGSLMQIGIYEAFLAIDWLGATKQVQTMGRFGR